MSTLLLLSSVDVIVVLVGILGAVYGFFMAAALAILITSLLVRASNDHGHKTGNFTDFAETPLELLVSRRD